MFGWIRKSVLFLIAIVIILLLITGYLFLTLALSLEIGTLKENSREVLSEIISDDIPVDDNLSLDDFIEDNYYKEYDCESFLNCFNEKGFDDPLFIISEMSQSYFMKMFVIIVIISLVVLLIALMFMSEKVNILFYTGFLIILSSLPFSKLDIFVGLSSIPVEFIQVVSVLFAESFQVFIVMIVLGVLLIIFGIISKIFLRRRGKSLPPLPVKKEVKGKKSASKKPVKKKSENVKKINVKKEGNRRESKS